MQNEDLGEMRPALASGAHLLAGRRWSLATLLGLATWLSSLLAPARAQPAAGPEALSAESTAPDLPTGTDIAAPNATAESQPPAAAPDSTPETLLFTNDRPRELWSDEKQDAFHSGEEEKEASVIDLVDSEVVSASNQAESSLTAPAWILSLSRQDLLDRGYVELTDLLDDLPSMDVIRPYGATYVASYWRGYRSSGNAPFLLMVDGVILNSIWANNPTVFGAIPLTSIDHVEVVYGPASAVYGPNAAMGVINVITNRGDDDRGLNTEVRLSSGAASSLALKNQTKIIDTSLRYHGEDFRILGSARLQFGVLDPGIGELFEWTKDTYYRSDHWGRFKNLPGVGEGFRSRDEKAGASLRLLLGQHAACGDRRVAAGHGHCTEVAVEHYQQTTGQGTVFPAPIAQTTPAWTYLEQGAHFRHVHDLTHALVSESRLRFRNSNVDKGSQRLFYEAVEIDGQVVPIIGGAKVGADSSAWIATQDFALSLGKNLLLPDDHLSVKLGARYQHISLDHDLIYSDTFVEVDGRRLTRAELESIDQLQPEAVDSRSNMDTAGIYLLGFYSIAATHYLNAGVRLDYSQSLRSTEPTVRAGYVGRLTPELTVKLLYGQAFQEPTMDELLNAQDDTGDASTNGICRDGCSNSNLKPEHSQTFELSVTYASQYVAVRLGGYYVTYRDAMVPDQQNLVRNAESRNVVGSDASLQLLLPLWEGSKLSLWAYYSLLALAEESDVDLDNGSERAIGDLATHKILGGVTVHAGEHLSLTLLGRFIGPRETVKTNPLNVHAYTTLDLNLSVIDILVRGLSLGVRVTNLLGTRYYHPGLMDASSGQDPNAFTDDFRWTGGPHNSLLPQPGREIFITLRLAY